MQQILVPAILLLIATGCNKNVQQKAIEKQPPLDVPGQSVVAVEQIVNEIAWMGRVMAHNYPAYPTGTVFFDCANVTQSANGNGPTLEILFNNNKCRDGHTRSGKVTVEVNLYTSDVTIQLDKYQVDRKKIAGSWMVQHTTGNGMQLEKLMVLNGQMIQSDGHFINFNVDRDVVWKAGEQTVSSEDDIMEIINGKYVMGIRGYGMLTATIADPLLLRWECASHNGFLPVSGKCRTGVTAVTSFGNGACDARPFTES